MSLDLGDLAVLAKALGLLRADGQPEPSWFADPGRHLSRLLANPVQRGALVEFVDELLGGPDATTDDGGRAWLPLVDVEDGTFQLFATLQETRDGAAVRVGAGVRVGVSSGGVDCRIEAHAPLFLAAGTAPVADPVLIGSADAPVEISLRVGLPGGTAPGGVELTSAVLAARVPTSAGEPASVRLALGGLRLPGAGAPRDLVVDVDNLDDLDDALLELVLGLVRAQVATLPAGSPLRGLATVLGLTTGPVPDFPVARLATAGPAALADWFAEAVTGPAQAAWAAGLAELLGGTVVPGTGGAGVELTVAGTAVRLDVLVGPGPSGRPVVVPRLSAGVAGGPDTRLSLSCDLLTLDLGSGTAVALPRLALTGQLAPPAGVLPPVTGPNGMRIAVGALRVGVALDAGRRPVLVVEAENADIGTTHYDRLDLSTPDAIAAVAGQAVRDAAAALLTGLGAAGDAVSVLIGLSAPASAAGVPLVDAAELLRDPVGAVRQRWRGLLATHAADVPTVLEAARDALADARVRTDAVTGSGTDAAPWRVPLAPGVAVLVTADAARLTLGIEAAVRVNDVGGSGADAALGLLASVVTFSLDDAAAAFLPGLRLSLGLSGPGGAPLRWGTGGLVVTAPVLGAELTWSPESRARVLPVLAGARLLLPDGQEVRIPQFALDAAGRLDLDAAGWAAAERIVGVLAEQTAARTGEAWPALLAVLLGWAPGTPVPTGSAHGNGLLPLADLVADPAAALGAFATALVRDEETLRPLLVLLAEALAHGAPSGRGIESRPWLVPLVRALGTPDPARQLPALSVSLGKAVIEPPSLVTPALRAWLPGDDGLGTAELIAELARETELDDLLADLLAARGDLVAGAEDLMDRWCGTDGLVALPDGAAPTGVTVHRPADLPHGTPLAGPELGEVLDQLWQEHLGGAPGTVVLVAIGGRDRGGAPDVLTGPAIAGLPSERVIDLTAPALPPEAFAGPPAGAAPQPLWAVALGTRAACRTATGAGGPDDGVAAQAGRLRRVLDPLTGPGTDVVVVAHGGAGHAALRAVAGLTGVRAVVTVGTPWSPVALDTLDAVPAGEALRLFAALLRTADAAVADPADTATDSGEDDDADLALARAAVAALLDREAYQDPLADLRPPEGLSAPAGVSVHAVVGALSAPALRRALTSVVAASLAARARARDRESAGLPGTAGPLYAGLSLPLDLPVGPGGLTAAVHAGFELAAVARDDTGTAAPPTGPAVRVRLELGAAHGWLVGGPDPGRASGGARTLACRRLTCEVLLPVRSWTTPLAPTVAHIRLVLHEAHAFGITRDRWLVEPGATHTAEGAATPLLPEVRALIAEIAARITAESGAHPPMAALREALTSLGVLGPQGGADAVTLERLLLDPASVVSAARTDPARRDRLAAALRTLASDPRADAGSTVDLRFGTAGEFAARLDLRTPALSVTAKGTTGLPWAVGVAAGPAGIGGTLRIGADPDTSATSPGTALVIRGDAAGLTAALHRRLPGAAGPAVRTTPLWPAPTAPQLLDAIGEVLPGLALGAVLEAARESLASLSATGAEAVDALLDALGLLAPAPAAPAGPVAGLARALGPVHDLLADPAGWLRALPGGPGLAVPALIDAVGRLFGGTGAPRGTVQLADGVRLTSSGANGRVGVSLDLDASAFTASPGGPTLRLTGGAGLSLAVADPADAAPLPDVRIALGLSGVGALRLRVGPEAGGAGDAVGVTLTLSPEGRPDIALLPHGPGLGGLVDAATAGAVAALPALLDALAAQDPAAAPASAAEAAGRFVTRIGDALGLRVGSPPRFDAAALSAFGTDPAAALAARGAALAADGLTLIGEAVTPLLGALPSRAVGVSGGALVLDVGPLTLRWRPGTAAVEAAVTLTGLPGVERLTAEAAVDATGLALFDLELGPAPLSAGILTLTPFARVRTGSASSTGRLVETGLGVGTDQRLVARWDLDAGAFRLVATGPGELPESVAPADVARVAVGALLDLAGGVVLAVPAVQAALSRPVLGTQVDAVLDGVLFQAGDATRLDPALAGELADPPRLLARLGALAGHLAAAPGAALPIDGRLTLRAHERLDGTTRVLGLSLAVDGRWELNPDADLVVSLENDAHWIAAPGGPVPAGLTVEVLALPAVGDPEPRPGLTVGGLGVRLARSGGPLLDAGVTIADIGLHLFAAIAPQGSSVSLAGGVRLELAGLGVPLAGATGGDNPVAQGLMSQAGTDDAAPAPRFSPAVSVQRHQGGPLLLSLTAGPGSGPWWLTVQRQYGPVYLEQVGLAVVGGSTGIESIGVLIDGRVSLLGLSAAVDDLSLTYLAAGGGSPFTPANWRVDLAGFAVAADVGGVTLAGGLRRFTPSEGGVEYLGMLTARMAVYGLSVYGGYGLVGPEDDRYASLFLFGAVNGPIGGPPAFFVTGIGGGFGINRSLSLPADLSAFDSFPLIKALDPSARAGEPFEELAHARSYFAPERGTFWFAAGLSFTSFALVDGVAVVALQVGNGIELSLLGLARMALPRPQAALVHVEMALVARFSTREGVILVQAQLTDNSWLLSEDVRLTGGFAFASWLSGPNRGQFVVTMGGYHPDFHRDGYPVVPRLGLAWRLGDSVSVTGEAYFALTSEAVMAGTRVEVSAELGPGWAHAVFGADGIVFFDPFWLSVTVYASIDAGVTIDLWFCEVTISVHLSAKVEVTGPPFRAVARFEVGPVGLTLEIGESNDRPRPLAWDDFVAKYLEQAAPGVARVLAVVPGAGAVPPAGSSGSAGAKSPDGTVDRPFRVVAEFELTVTSTVPLRRLVAGGPARDLPADRVVSVAPMALPGPADPALTLRLVGPPTGAVDRIGRLTATAQRLGAFPVGAWGAAQDLSRPTVPEGEVVSATDRVLLRAFAQVPAGGPAIEYRQVETGPRRLNPLIVEDDDRRLQVLREVADLAALKPVAAGPQARLDAAAGLLADRGRRSPADVAAWRADRAAAPPARLPRRGSRRSAARGRRPRYRPAARPRTRRATPSGRPCPAERPRGTGRWLGARPDRGGRRDPACRYVRLAAPAGGAERGRLRAAFDRGPRLRSFGRRTGEAAAAAGRGPGRRHHCARGPRTAPDRHSGGGRRDPGGPHRRPCGHPQAGGVRRGAGRAGRLARRHDRRG
ncbi:hypothetical protein BN159_7447 [Streptomyces davaonensis JCM 4913]|uniref:DUF6603 domain-containing protein n=1 Tax=Streptomyces davaonensis (strain DSM 101723 / JCM 4913 / KCC S-0913 / 768) TaxID=1214101 RepID=K4R6G9_STRDJ|nr:DUF6603 domain-containing protein [Streptomyces davaonensis]CCK31826.1 hypothetical protein BN159_7447 [Streptomyces davaonensis JCM 4913]